MAVATKAQGKKDHRSKLQKTADKFKLNAHYEIERFRIVLVILTTIGILLTTIVGISAYRSHKADISAQAQYTTEFMTSRTKQAGMVNGIYTNPDHTRAVVLMSFSEDDEMSTEPNDYSAYIVGVNSKMKPEKSKTAMTGRVVTFGDTKSLGVILDAPEGFDMQVLNLTMTAKKELVDPQPMDDEELAENLYDESFKTNDRWRVVFNPAADLAQVLPELDDSDFKPRKFLANTVFRANEQKIRADLDESLVSMKTQQDRINSYYKSIEKTKVDLPDGPNAQLVPPTPPELIAGDKVDGLSREEVGIQLNEGKTPKGIDTKSDEAREVDTYADGFMPSTYKLTTDKAVPGGVDFNWRDTTIQEGYKDDLVPTGHQLRNFIGDLKKAGTDVEDPSFGQDFMMSTGKPVDRYDDQDSGMQKLIMTGSNLVQAYRGFYTEKKNYQSNLLVDLLELEADLDDAVNETAVSDDPSVFEIER